MTPFALLAGLTLAAPSVRVAYEQKCLYCHSEEVSERKVMPEAAWRKLIEQKHLKSPMLITRADIPALTRYMARTLKLAPKPLPAPPPAPAPVPRAASPGADPSRKAPSATPAAAPPAAESGASTEAPAVVDVGAGGGSHGATSTEPAGDLSGPTDSAEGPIDPAADARQAAREALDQQGYELMQRRCSRCHTLTRVYGKLDSLERSLAIIERMRLRTGSGITDRDLKVLKEYVRAQFE